MGTGNGEWTPRQERALKRLPDVYARDKGSRIAGLLHALTAPMGGLWADNADVTLTSFLEACQGPTLDLYGKMLDQPRGAMDDKAYRIVLLTAIARSFVDGTYESVMQGILDIFKAERQDVAFHDDPEKSGVVKLTMLPFDALNGAGLTTRQAVALINRLLPAGVRVEADQFEGTFEFDENDGVEDIHAGFAVSEQDQTIGGTLGAVLGDDDAPALPI